jgi:hypothetical protein
MSRKRPVVEVMDPMMVEVIRSKTPAERLAIAFRMWDSARVIVSGGVRYQYPDWSEAEVEQEIAARMRGRIGW